jgi:hypothetical protein
VCSGFLLMDARPTWYDSEEEAARVVVVHELFHLVQKSYTGDLDSWFAEGTAQWAADRLTPTLGDMESFFPSFYEEAHRSIDNPPGGVATGFLYGTAIYPLYLDRRFGGPRVVRETLEGLAVGLPLWEAIDTTLGAEGTTLEASYPEFGAWLASTGERQGIAGFPLGANYPTLDVGGLPTSGVNDRLSGFGIRAYELTHSGEVDVDLDADPARVRGFVVPLEDGLANLSSAATLPGSVTSPALVVVTGVASQKSDADFSVRWTEAQVLDPDPEPLDPSSVVSDSEGCSVQDGYATSLGWPSLVAYFLLVRRRRRPTDVGGRSS